MREIDLRSGQVSGRLAALPEYGGDCLGQQNGLTGMGRSRVDPIL